MPKRGSISIRTWLVALLALVGATLGATLSIAAITANPTPVCAANVCTVTFAAGNEYTFTAPASTPLTFSLKGGKGGTGGNDAMSGSAGKAGDTITFSLTSDGTAISVYPGSAGGDGVGGAGNGGGSAGVSAYPNNGYDGGIGGHAGPACCSGGGGGGGAASVVTVGGVDYVAAGGAGGAGGDQFCTGPAANAYALANSTAATYGKPGINASGDGSGSGGGGGGARGGNGGAMGSCSSETLGYGGYSGSSFAPAGATTTVAANNATGTITISYPDKIATTVVPTATDVKGVPVTYAVTFAEAVTGLTTSDFQISGSATGCLVSSLTGSGTTYQVTITGCVSPSGSKTVILTLPADSAANATSRGNAVTIASTVTIDDVAPTALITGPSPVAQTSAFDFVLTGSEALSNVAAADFSLTGSGCSLDTVTGTGVTRTIRVIGCANGATAKLTLAAGSITDLAGNTAPTAAIASSISVDIPAAPAKLTDAVITGTTSNGLLVGDTLTVSGATFSPANHNNVIYNTNTFVWYRCYTAQSTASSSVASDCEVIRGATAASYKITQNEIGYFIRGAMVATNATGTIFSASANSPVVREYDPLSSTWYATCVVKEGLVYCWGDNAYGQMGDGTTVDVLAPNAQPVKLSNGNSLTGVVSVDTGSEHTCALTNQGAMYCWGRNNWSQLGDGTTVAKSVATPVTATATGPVGFGSDVVAISAGEADTCVLKAGGAAYCWGVNDYGQMADGTSTTKVTPTRVLSAASTPLTNITDIEVNRYNVCVLSNSGSVTGQVYCAGHGGNGQMANGTTTASNTYLTKAYASATDSTFTGATDISVASHHICAVRNGAAYCWGINSSGQLGSGNSTAQSYPTIPLDTAAGVSFASGVTQVETSKNATGSSCFLKATGVLYCSGLGTSGQLTDGTIISKTTAVASTLFTSGTWTMSIGELFTCGIDSSGLSCIGNNNNGQLGNGTTVNSTTAEVNQPMFTAHLGAVDERPVAGGSTETGYAGTGQLLTGATTVEAATGSWYGYPLPVLTYQWWRCTATGPETTTLPSDCAPISGATAKTYTPVAADVGSYLRFEVIGTNSAGVTGDWSATSTAVGVAPSNTALPTIALKAGSAGTIVGTQATATAGTWSGNPTPSSSFIWYRCTSAGSTATLTAPSDCVQIGDATGATYTFTASDVGQYVRAVDVAQSSSGINYAFTATVGPVTGSRVITAGYNHTCVIKLGYVYCWGYNGYGNLGDGTTTSTNSMPTTPIKLSDGSYLKNVVSIDASANTTCALTTAGAMYCWGYNGYGEIGDGTTTNRSVPTPVTGLSSGVSYIAAGIASTCAVKTDGSLYCWGYNANGQLGDNTNTQRTSPVQVITATSTPITNVVQVSLGWQHTCAIKVGGALYCWGYNGNGMVGDNSTSARWMPTAVSGMSSGVTDVSAGYYYTCAVKNGGAWCWGYNANGQLGDGTATQRLVPVAVSDTTASPSISMASGVIDVEANDYDPGYSCFVKQSQKVYCTGYNVYGQLGIGNTSDVTKATAPSLFSGNVTGAALGRYHTCLIMDLKVSCIGYNGNGELANGTNTSNSTTLSTRTAFGNPSGALDVLPVSGGATVAGYSGTGQTLTGSTNLDALTGTWAGYSYPVLTYQWWSCSSQGLSASIKPGDCSEINGATSTTYSPVAADLGRYLRFEVVGTNSAGSTLAFSATSAAVGVAPANTTLPTIASKAGSAGAIVGSGAVATAGAWSGTPTPTSTFTWMRCSSAVATSSTTAPSGCVLIGDATGANYTFTQSDVGSYIVAIDTAVSSSGISSAYTSSIGPIQESRTLAAGSYHFCAIKLGMVYCWGANAYGQLGDGTTTNRNTIPSTPVKLADGSYLKNVVSIAAEQVQTCAVTTAGALYCWGFNNIGQIGDGTTTTRTVPTLVSGMSSGVVGVSVGVYGGCAIKAGGTLWCWGSNGYGVIGDNTTTARPTPVQVLSSVGNFITGVTQVSHGSDPNVCAIKSGALYCWGYNGYGNLGDGTFTNRSMPTAVPGMGSNVTDVSSGDHTCAIKNGATYCWGWDNYGQQGDGANTTKSSPVAAINSTSSPSVSFSSGVFDIETADAATGYSCLIKQSMTLYCAGYNANGQLGTGTTTASNTFTPATLFAGKVSAVALAASSTCAIVDGNIACIGLNTSGEIANGTNTNSSSTLSTQAAFGNPTGALDVAPISGGSTYTGYTGVGQVVTGATTLDSITGTWIGYSYPTLTYQWLRCGSSGAASFTFPGDCKSISGATSISYTATSADVGNYLRFEVIGTNSAGVAIAVSASGSTPVGLTPVNTALPNLVDIDGGYAGVIPGVTLSVNSGSYSGTPTPATTYSWYRCFTSVASSTLTPPSANDCQLISSASNKTYTVTGADVGFYVRGIETSTSTSGRTSSYTETSTLVRESHTIVAGDNHSCSIRLGRVYCWGLNTSGQLGDGTTTSRTSAVGPVKLANSSVLENVVSISAGASETCAITVQGSLYCWGTETYGEFGDGVTSATYTSAVQAKLNSTTVISDAVGLATGNNHTCVIRTGGSVWCWGYNVYGQVGDGTTTNRTYPVQIISSGVQQVSADYMQTCALVSGALKCWGLNGNYNIGDGTNTSRNAPVAVTGMSSGVSYVAVGYAHTCAIKNGGAYCWGYNGYGQLGDGTNVGQNTTPVAVANSAAGVSFAQDVIAIDASESNPEHTCLVKVGGAVYCFGVGANSALANGSTANSNVPSPSTLWTSGVTEIATGYQFTCVTKAGGDYCTGYNASGQVGNGSTTNATGSVAISAIADNAGALDVAPYAGAASVGGTPAVGQTLTGSTTGWVGFPMPTVTYQWYNCVKSGAAASSIPVDCQAISGATNLTYVPTASDVNNYVRFVATATSAAGVTSAVTAGQWVGTLPDATFIERTTAPAGFIPIGTIITQYADQWEATPAATVTNAWYRCASTGAATEVVPIDCTVIAGATGSTYTTTQSDVGSYVRGAQVATNTLGATIALAPTAGYVAETRTVAVGTQTTCVVKAGEVWCAGLGTSGQLGNNAILSSSTPVKVLTAAATPLTKVIDVVGNAYSFCAITESGALYCWGNNVNGTVGNGTNTNVSLATLVTSGTSYAAADAGVHYTCAIKVGGALYCWGLNTSSQLGDGTSVNKSVPTLVTGMGSGVSQVSAGWQSTCAIKNGGAFCWGSNTNYMLGDGTATARSMPTQVGPTQVAPIVNFTSGVTDIAMSTISACLVKDGSAYCWGNAAVGQIGTGATAGNAGYPVQVVATTAGTVFTSGVADIEVSVNNNSIDSGYITKTDGSLYAFGSQVNGVLFNAATTGNSPRPIAATGYASGVNEVSAGWGNVCVVKNGALNCVGLNDNGQLFNSPATLNTTPVTTPTSPASFASGLGDVALAPTLVTAPSVDATPGLANVSPADPGAFSSNPAATLTYAWYACTLTSAVSTSVPADCTPATGSGAASLYYTPVASDQGKYLRLSVTATNAAGSVTSVSATSTNPIAKGDHTLTIASIASPVIGGAAVTLSATDSANLPVTYSSNTLDVCTVAAGKVTAISGGRCEIIASNAGNSTYNAASASLEVFIDQLPNVITFTLADRAYSTSTVALSGAASSQLAVTYASSTPTVCTVGGSTLTLVAVGTCTVTASQSGNASVVAAAPVVVNMQISKATQTISLAMPASISLLNASGVTLSPTSSSGLAVTLDVDDPTVCNFVGGKLVALALGTCRVIAAQVGDSKYSPVSTTYEVLVTRAPSVTAVTTSVSSPTNLASVPVTLTFDTPVTGLAVGDLSTSPAACTVSSVSGSGTTYTVTLTNCAEGSVALRVAANSVSNGADGPEATYTSSELFVVDKTAPTITSATTASAAKTNASSVDFTVTFSEPVTGFTSTDVANGGTATGCVASVTQVSTTVYTVSMSSCGEGTVAVRVAAASAIDLATNAGPAATYTSAAVVTIDRTAANVASITTTAPANTKTSPVPFVVTFTEPVIGFTAEDLMALGTSTGCTYSVTAVSTTVYNVSVSSCTDGTVGIKVAAASVTDIAGNASPVAAFSSTTVTLDTAAPAAPVFTTTAQTKTNTLPIAAVLTFAEPVTGLTASDLSFTGTATSCQLAVSAVSTTVYNVSISACSDGTVALTLATNAVSDLAGNTGPISAAASGILTTVDRVAPTVSSITTSAPGFTNTQPIPFVVTFSEGVTELVAADLRVAGTATGCELTIVNVSDAVYNVGVASCDTDGTVGLQVLASAITDLSGNVGPSVATSSSTVVLDTVAPDAPVLSNMPGDFTTSGLIEATFDRDARFTYTCEFDGTPISCPTGSIHLGSLASPLADGAHNLQVTVTDQAGNTSVAANYDWTIGNYVKPLAPDAPVATRTSLTTMSVAWNKPVASAELPIQGYELSYTTDSITWLTATKTVGEDATDYVLPGITSGVVYKFKVKSLTTLAADSSPWSAEGPYVAVYIPNIVELTVGQSSLTPPAGSTLTIKGQDFKANQTTVTFGDVPAVVQSVNAAGTEAVVVIPNATVAGQVDINVTVGSGQFTGASRKAKAFTYVAAPIAPVITHTAPTGVSVGAPAVAFGATVNSGATLVYTIAADSAAVCRVEGGNKLVGLTPGTCNYNVSAPATAAYTALAPKAYSTTIAKGANQTSFTLPAQLSTPTVEITDNGIPLSASSSSGITPTFTASPEANCFVDSLGELHLLKLGNCSVTATSGSANYVTSSVTNTFTVTKGTQTIAFVSPGADIPFSMPLAKAPIASNDPNGFRLIANTNSGLPLTYTSLNPTVCEVDSDGIVLWLANLKAHPTDVKYNTCNVKISQAGNANYAALTPFTAKLVAVPVKATAPPGGVFAEPTIKKSLPRTSSKTAFGSYGFDVKVTPTSIAVSPFSKGFFIGPVTATVNVSYKLAGANKVQKCVVKFGTLKKMTKAQGAFKIKNFTTKLTCAFNKDAYAYFKAGNSIQVNAVVVRDRRWPTTYLQKFGTEDRAGRIGQKIYPTKRIFDLSIG